MAKNLTEKRKKEFLPDSEEMFRALFEHTSDGLFVVTPQGDFLEVNQQLCDHLCYSRDEMLSLSLNHILRERDFAQFTHTLSTIQEKLTQPQRCHFYDSKGDMLTADLSIIALAKGSLLGVVHGPKAQVWTEEQFYKSEERFQMLAESSLTGMYLIQEGCFSYVNTAFANMFGYEVEEVLNEITMQDLIYPEDRPLVQENIRRRVEGDEDSIRYVFRGLRKNGSIIYVEVHGRRIQYRGKAGVIGTLIDISTARQAEEDLHRLNEELEAIVEERTHELKKSYRELKSAHTSLLQQEKMASIGQLAAGIAHEINTPIQFISDNITFLRESVEELLVGMRSCQHTLLSPNDAARIDDLPEDLKDVFEHADLDYLQEEIPLAFESSFEGIRRISRIVSAMKEFAQPSGEKFAPVNLENLINTTVEISRNTWKQEAELIIEQTIPPLIVEGLKDDLGQVILNLIVNAADAIKEIRQQGHGLGCIRIRTCRSGDNWAEIIVEDSGCGMSLELQKKIFEPFFTTKVVGRGSGQGLAITYHIIHDKHGGELLVDSSPGKGSTFTIRLPITR